MHARVLGPRADVVLLLGELVVEGDAAHTHISVQNTYERMKDHKSVDQIKKTGMPIGTHTDRPVHNYARNHTHTPGHKHTANSNQLGDAQIGTRNNENTLII